MILARRHDWRLSDALPAGRTRSTPDTTAPRPPPPVPHGLARDSPCTCQKLQDLLRGRVPLSPPAGSPARCWSWIAALCALRPRQPQHPRDLAFAHFLRIQFQNRGSLCLAQHVCLPAPFRFLPPSAPAFAALVRSGPALVSLWCCHLRQRFGQSPSARRRMAIAISRSRSTCSTAARLAAAAAAAFSKTVPDRRECVCGSRACPCARPYRVGRPAAYRNGAR